MSLYLEEAGMCITPGWTVVYLLWGGWCFKRGRSVFAQNHLSVISLVMSRSMSSNLWSGLGGRLSYVSSIDWHTRGESMEQRWLISKCSNCQAMPQLTILLGLILDQATKYTPIRRSIVLSCWPVNWWVGTLQRHFLWMTIHHSGRQRIWRHSTIGSNWICLTLSAATLRISSPGMISPCGTFCSKQQLGVNLLSTSEISTAQAVVFDHSTPGKPRPLISIWPATIQNFRMAYLCGSSFLLVVGLEIV